jgi:hypothetical protein
MNLKHTASIAGCVAALLTAAPAWADPMGQAVTVNGCAASPPHNAQTWLNVFGSNVHEPAMPAMLMIDFQNASSKPISSVDFGFVQNGRVVTTVRDVGMFAPNAVIMHAYGLDYTVPNASGTCVPLRIQYADGSSWMNPTMPAH